MKLSINETRKFKSGELKNGIKYTIISDKYAEKASMATAVNTGSYFDPENYDGLAHFLEHMLFLGSKKYPKEDYFDATLKKYGGNSNAFTAQNETVYYFNVNDNYLEKVIDIFSHFFIDPLFDKDSVCREINAVNSEHEKNITNDTWIRNQIIKNMSKKKSPINRFSTGNLDTLDKPDIREKMIEFYNKYYTSNNIVITIISSKSIDFMEKIIIEKFSIIKKKFNDNSIIKKSNYFDTGMEYVLYPHNDKNYIMYFWEIGLPQSYSKNMISDVIEEIINSEDPNNLEKILINKDLIKGLFSYTNDESVFILIIDINNDNNIHDTIKSINSYIKYYFNNLDKLNWNKIYDFIDKKYNVMFDYSNKINDMTLILDIVVNMFYYKPENYYFGNRGIISKDYDELNKTIKMLKFDNCNIVYCTKNIKADFIEDKYYHSKYGKIINTLKNSKNIEFDFNVILENKYYDIKPKVIKGLDTNIIPQLLDKRTWYGSVSKFNETVVFLKLILSDSLFISNLKDNIATNIAIGIINYYLSSRFNKEFDLGYTCSVSLSTLNACIEIKFYGYNDKFNLFYNDIIQYLKDIYINLDESIINIEKQDYLELLLEIEKSIPWTFSNNLLFNLIYPYDYSYLDKIKYIKENNINDSVKIILKKICTFDNIAMTIFTYGNITLDMLPDFSNLKKNTKLPLCKIPMLNKINDITIQHPNENIKNNFIMVLFELDCFTPQKKAIEMIILLLIKQPVYDFLRTKNQLGYLVDTNILKLNNLRYFYIKVQSEKKNSFVISKITEFLKLFDKMLLNKLNTELDSIKDVIKKEIELKESNTSELVSKYYYEIFVRDYMFNRDELIYRQVDDLTIDDIYNYYCKIISDPKIMKITSN